MTVSNSLLSGNYMTHNSVLTNNGTHYNTSNSRFVCPVAGYYFCSIMVMSNNNSQTMDLELHKNGSNANNILVPYNASTGGAYIQCHLCLLHLHSTTDERYMCYLYSLHYGYKSQHKHC